MITREAIGVSLEGRDIMGFALSGGAGIDSFKGETLIVGGIHGDEAAGPALLTRFIDDSINPRPGWGPAYVIPVLNPDGFIRNQRENVRGVDLNRNFPFEWDAASPEYPGAFPLSEPESIALHDFMHRRRPARVLCLHWALSEIDPDGEPGRALASHLYSRLDDDGKKFFILAGTDDSAPQRPPLPGTFGRWCGHALQYPDGSRPAMVTLELPYHCDPGRMVRPLPADRLEKVRSLWGNGPETYLRCVGPAVFGILDEACMRAPENQFSHSAG